MCSINPTSWGGCVGDVVGGAASDVAGGAWDYVVGQFEKGLADVMKALTTFWINAPSPDLTSQDSAVKLVNEVTLPLAAFAAVIGLIIGGARLWWRAHDTDGPRAIMRGLVLIAVVGGGAATIAGLLVTAMDSLSKWILTQGFNGQSIGERLGAIATIGGSVGSGLIFILALLGLISSLCQFGLLLVRGGLLAVVVGMLPVSAAASVTDTGYEWFKKMCGWCAAFILYKPAAAIIYAAGFYMIGNGDSLTGVISGFTLIIVSILALPALMRLIVPAAARMGGGRGGAGAAAAGAVAATGAAVWGGGKGGQTPMTQTPGLVGAGGGAGGGAAAAAPTGAVAAAGGPAGMAAHYGIQAAQQVHAAAKAAAQSAIGEE